jgi:uncharacterized RDD family membrane protein YckC
LRQSAQKAENTLSWKQEVNRRVAEHRERKNGTTNDAQSDAAAQPAPGSRAAAAAARVAARYASAPSYSEMLAEEARAAVRAAEAASRAALDAQAAAEQVLAGLEAASSAKPEWQEEFFTPAAPELVPEPVRAQAVAPETPRMAAAQTAIARPAASAVPAVSSARPSFEIRFDADLPVREVEPQGAWASHGRVHESHWDSRGPLHTEGYEVVEPALPIHANLIEFPRELVAARKVRPRRAEAGYAAIEEQGQLSIFEVDPASISTEPESVGAQSVASTPAWTAPKWSGITLDEEPREEMAAPLPSTWVEREEPAPAAALQPADLHLRMMAALVDFSLVTAGFVAVAALTVARMAALPAMRAIEMESAAGIAVIGIVYLAFFFLLAGTTPGMKYARLELRTLGGEKPNLKQRSGRLAAMLLSLLPVGLGAVLALFDEQHLCWHDRLSGTYPRKA